MGLMEVELALAEHRRRTQETERRHSIRRTVREREEQGGTRSGAGAAVAPRQPEQPVPQPGLVRPKLDWPVFTLRLGPLRLALFRTVRLPSGGPGRDSHGTPRVLPG